MLLIITEQVYPVLSFVPLSKAVFVGGSGFLHLIFVKNAGRGRKLLIVEFVKMNIVE